MDMLFALLRYLAATLADGDYANDWLTHLPRVVRPLVQALGQALAHYVEHAIVLPATALHMLDDLASCGDPTLPAYWVPSEMALWHTLTRLYDALLTLGVC